MSNGDIRRWVVTWERAGRELTRIRREELASMTDEQAKLAALDLLSIPLPEDLPPKRESGLVEQQRLFSKLRASR